MKHWHIWIPFLLGQFGFDFGGPGTFFGDVLAFIEGEIVAALSFLFDLIVVVANFLLSLIQFVFHFFLTLATDIKNGFKWLWDNVVKVGLTKLVSVFVRLQAWLSKYVGRVVRFLVRLRKWYDQYFNQFVKPVLNTIRHIRQVLSVFRLLGLKWAARLDARLALIENRIVQAYELLRVNLNKVISFAQLIADPFAILRRNPVLGAVIRDAPEIKNAIDRATNHATTQKELDSSNHDNGWFQKGAAAGNAAYFKGGPRPEYLTDARADFTSARAELPGLALQDFPRGDDGLI